MGTRIRGRAGRPAPSDPAVAEASGPNPDYIPVFTLKATDVCAPATIRGWAALAAEAGSPAEKIGGAMLDAVAIEAWQRRHGCKTPD